MDKNIQKHLFIEGKVQGVGFRSYMAHKAKDLNLTGWVKNLSDGKVEAVLKGSVSNVNEMIKLVKKGPPWARVDSIKVEEENVKEFKDFKIIY